MKVRTVIWDCDGVIWFHKKNEAEIVAKELGIREIETFSKEFYNMFDDFMKEFENKKVTKKALNDFIEKAMPTLYFYNISPQKFLEKKEKIKSGLVDFNNESKILIKYLTEKNIRNIVKSDWIRLSQENLLKEYDMIQYIEKLYCCDNSYLKQNKKSIAEIIKQGREDEYIIIGDTLTSDICFAKNAGIKSIWFNPQRKENTSRKYLPTFEVTSLLEVRDIL